MPYALDVYVGDLWIHVTGEIYHARHDLEKDSFEWEDACIHGVSIVPLLDSLGTVGVRAFSELVDKEFYAQRGRNEQTE